MAGFVFTASSTASESTVLDLSDLSWSSNLSEISWTI